jgi:hypothetical protein
MIGLLKSAGNNFIELWRPVPQVDEMCGIESMSRIAGRSFVLCGASTITFLVLKYLNCIDLESSPGQVTQAIFI